jgi:predicted ATPase
LYQLDEPEAPLSPLRQLALIPVIKDMASQNGKIIIAAHSPILMACPYAVILKFDGGEIHPAKYKDLENVRLIRDFRQIPELFLRNL